MFDAFQQADSSISRRYGGTGLGLPIARTLAERMGGTLRAESHQGQGSVFTLEIPLPFRQQVNRTDGPYPDQAAAGNGQDVLLVEDNPVNQTVIEAMLRSLGYRVSLVSDGAQAVQAASRTGFAAILMDCRLPVLDGYEATRQIRGMNGGTRVPIIALTANALQGDREACLEAGMNDYLAKPFKRADLQRVLQRWLGGATDCPRPSVSGQRVIKCGRLCPRTPPRATRDDRNAGVRVYSVTFTATQQSMTSLPIRRYAHGSGRNAKPCSTGTI